MKKLLFILITIPLIFSSCEKEEDNQPNNNGTNNQGLIGYSFGNNGINNEGIYKTTDGGNNWILLYSLSNQSDEWFIDFVSENTG